MSRLAPKPVLLVGLALVALIVLPLLVLLLAQRSGSAVESRETVAPDTRPAVDFDLQQLVDRSALLLGQEIPEAVRRGEASLDFVAGLERLRAKAEDAVADGEPDRARKHYGELVARSEAVLASAARAEEARVLQESVLSGLRRLERFRGVFGETFSEAVKRHDEGSTALAKGDFEAAIGEFTVAQEILSDLEGRASSRIESLMEAAASALRENAFGAARAGYEEVLRMDPRHEGAKAGIAQVEARAELGGEVLELEALEEAGRLDEAIEVLAALESKYPENPYIMEKRAALEERLAERAHHDLLAAAERLEASGDFEGAIEALEEAYGMRPEAGLRTRISALEEKRDAARLEQALESGYSSLSDGRYEEARERYREALTLAPESEEARTGFKKASTLFFASIRFRENLANAEKFAAEGRFPLAAKFFNDAMASRPAHLPESVEEREMREELERQSQEVPVVVLSDKRTYVSLIGVFAPERFNEKDLRLYPDVYTFQGSRRGYREVEVTLKVNARMQSQEVEVRCREKL